MDNDGTKSSIIYTNTGWSPATNVSSVITYPTKVISVNTLAAYKISIQFISDNIVQLNFTRLNTQAGSIIRIDSTIDADSSRRYYEYSAVADYNQGSTTGRIRTFSIPDNVMDFVNKYPLNTIFIILSMMSFLIFLILFIRKKRRNRFVSEIIQNMIKIRQILKNDPDNSSNQYPFTECRSRIQNQKGDRLFDVKDYIRIIDFSTKLEERSNYMISQNKKPKSMDDTVLKKYNEECLRLADDALMNINWKRYKS